MKISHLFKLIPVVLLLFATCATAAGEPKNIQIHGSVLVPPREIADFQLTDNQGKSFNNNNLQSHWTMLFFGFTNCHKACPTALASLNKMTHILEQKLPSAKIPQVVFITIDPERDTLARLNSFIKAVNPNFIAARGDRTAILQLEKELHIVADKKQTKNNYSFDHSAEVLLINPQGKLQAYLSFPYDGEVIARDYQTILDE